MSFEITLKRAPTTQLWHSEGADKSPLAKKLQDLFDRGLSELYDQTLTDLQRSGAKFRLTDGKVYQIQESDQLIQAPIKFQVKGGTMTWYIVAPKDETYQSFRDEIYGAAGLGHLHVTNHCEKYWRGTNSLHVKLMHTREDESFLNHNHYRMKDCDADPQAVYEHLFGFVQAQKDLGLVDEDGKEKYLNTEEAREIYEKFEQFWIEITHVGPAKTISLRGKSISLPSSETSILDAYRNSPEEVLTPEDIAEWEENKSKQEPCISISNWDSLTVTERLKAIAEGMRGLGSELAQTRQISGSKYGTHSTIVKRDDAITSA